jgi:RNase adapter protein RapZ
MQKDTLNKVLGNTDVPNKTRIHVESFGTRHHQIDHKDYDLLFNLQALKVYNPYYIAGNRTGLDKSLQDLIFSKSPGCYKHILEQVQLTLKSKNRLEIGICCTGGKHRSVAFVERLHKDLIQEGHVVEKTHLDIFKD